MKTQEVIKLKFPVQVAGETVHTLTMRRPLALDVLASHEATTNETDQQVYLLANLCMVSPETIGELDAADYRKANEAFSDMADFDEVENYTPGAPIPLNVPAVIGGAQTPSLMLRRPKVKDIQAARKVEGSDAMQETELFAALASVTAADIKNLDWSDYRKLKTIYGDFLA